MPTPVEDYTKCLFGRTDVRMGTRVIATFNIMVTVVTILTTMWSVIIEGHKVEDDDHQIDQSPRYLQVILNKKSDIFMGFVILYFNFYLRKTTYDKNIENIKHWLVLYMMNLIYIFVDFGCTAFVVDKIPSIRRVYGFNVLIILGIFKELIIVYFLSVVKSFYQDKLSIMSHLVPAANIISVPLLSERTQKETSNGCKMP